MRGKAKQREMRALRAAGLTLAGAERLTQTKGGSTAALSVLGGLGIMVLAGVGVLSMNLPASDVVETEPTPAVTPAAIVPDVAVDVATTDVIPASTELASTPVTDAALSPAEDVVEMPWLVALEQEPQTTPQPVETSVAIEVEKDCVVTLAAEVSGVLMQFDAGSALVPPGSYDQLWHIGTQVNACPEARVLVAGHSDSSGSDLANLQLSWTRAENTVEALSALGLDTGQFETVGFGSRAPIEQGSNGDDGINRRVELRVLNGGTR
ncbi:OmpA family protein [Tateyamaria omphalii]|uniref:OmpA family protein n=1 Tax=Tateyamaria omphalii TaxID=299262 RepID=UPI001C999862|nr:OmpA family protein [Tateyamaria omphalii]MBY5934666.1 OmpA family protein [Tateyamaria omphalii]